MDTPSPSFEDLLKSYRAALLARIQRAEYAGWGGSFDATFRARIAEHEKLEAAFVAAEIERRRAG